MNRNIELRTLVTSVNLRTVLHLDHIVISGDSYSIVHIGTLYVLNRTASTVVVLGTWELFSFIASPGIRCYTDGQV
jgi:hypothetical protein